MLMEIFLFRSHPAADMTLRLVDIKHNPGLLCKPRIDVQKAFCYVFMYSCR